MALISIPSTIGGVTIPGTSSSGPLGALFGSQYGLKSLQYPRDLGSMTKGHFVQFSMFQRQPQKFTDFQSTQAIKNIADNGLNTNTALAAGEALQNDGTTLLKNTTDKLFTPNGSALGYTPEIQSKPDVISLYMPDTVNITNHASYNNTSIMGAVQEALGLVSRIPVVGALASVPNIALSALNSNPAKLALATQGLAINPKNQLLFEGIDFRTYQLSFTFTPYSAEEAETVKQIIKTFKMHAAPTIVTQSAGMFFRPPSTVSVQFMYNGKENPNIAKVAESVIESIDVNYAPNGWAAHDNGAPVQTTLTINFKEIQLIDSEMIKNQGF